MAKKKKVISKKKKTYRIINFFKNKQTHLIFGVFLALFSIFLLVSFISFFSNWQADQSQLDVFTERISNTKNLLGKIGAKISHFFIYRGFGLAAFILPILLFLTGIVAIFHLPLKQIRRIWFWGVINMFWIALAMGFFFPSKSLIAGIVGFEINDFLSDFIGRVGVFLILLFSLLAFVISRLKLTPEMLKEKLPKRKEKIKGDTIIDDVTDGGYITETVPEKSLSEIEFKVKEKLEVVDKVKRPELELESTTAAIKIDKPIVVSAPKEEMKIEVEKTFEEDHLVESLSNKLVEDFGEFDPTLELGNFKFPPLDLLKEYTNENIKIDQEELELNKNKIVDTLSNYKIGIASIKATIGPTVTLYEIVPDKGVRISKIKNLEDDIALSLAALGIRIIAPIPGKGTIGIEVPNKNSTIVSMKSVLSTQKFQNAKMELPLALGKTISNETFVIDLAKMPHLLMAGATGQGKSVGLNAVLTSLLYKKHPAEVKFVLVDPKKVELTLFNKIERHYLKPARLRRILRLKRPILCP